MISAAEALGNAFRKRYVAPDTCADDGDVPVLDPDAHASPGAELSYQSDKISHPGAASFTASPQLLVGWI